MFYACLSILVLMTIMLICVTLNIIDLETYNFGLYIILLCIVGTMLACALCIANPNACANPHWYTNFCVMVQEMQPSQAEVKSAGSEMNGLRSRMIALHSASAPGQVITQTSSDLKLPLRQESRATVAMLAPAVHIMHQVWRGMAWVADGIDEDDDATTKSYDPEQGGISHSESHTDSHSVPKRLSTIAESNSSQFVQEHELEESSSEFTSSHDVMV